MNTDYKYSLAKKGKSFCPACGKKRFVLYTDNETGQPVHETVGRCDRKDECKYHKPPKKYFEEQDITYDKKTPCTPSNKPKQPKNEPQPQPSFIDTETLYQSLNKRRFKDNQLIKFLCGLVGYERTKGAIERYFIGTSERWDGATVFWQIDLHRNVRTGKVMQYDSATGKRIKDSETGKPLLDWVHSILLRHGKLPDFNLSQCFFGEHLLVDTTKTVAIVESEKTAVIASIYRPQYIWLACGGSEGISTTDRAVRMCQVLKGRNVVLFPDAGMYENWNKKSKVLESICSSVFVSDVIENEETGSDIADFLVKISFDRDKLTTPIIQEHANDKQPLINAYTEQEEHYPTDMKSSPQLSLFKMESAEQHQAYVASDGTLYIPTPPDRRTTYTVRESVEAYNQRKGTISFIPMQNVDTSGMKQVFINLKTLTI